MQPRNRSHHSTQSKPDTNRRRAVHSFWSAVFGWFVTFSVFLALCAYFVWVTDSNSIGPPLFPVSFVLLPTIAIAFVLSASATLAGWVCVGLPIALKLRRRLTRHLWLMIVIHMVATVFTFLIARQLHEVFVIEGGLINIWQESISFIGLWAASTGLFGGAFFWWLQKRR